MTLHILWTALWALFSYTQQLVSGIAYLIRGILITYFPMQEVSATGIGHFVKDSFISSFSMTNLQEVSDIAHFVKGSQSHYFFSYNEQLVSEISCFVPKGNLITLPLVTNSEWVPLHILSLNTVAFLMTNSKWVTLHSLGKAISLYLCLLWPTVCEWHCTFVKNSLIMSFPMTNSEWVTLQILWIAVSSYDQQFVCGIPDFVKGGLITSYEQQAVSDSNITHFMNGIILMNLITSWQQFVSEIVKGSLITSFSMANSEWVTLQTVWKRVSLHLFLWPTASEWHCTFCEKHCYLIYSHDQQRVSDIAHFEKGSLITSFPMTHSLWVRFHTLWKAVSSYLILWPKGSEWLDLWKAVSSILLLWPTASKWHCTLFEMQFDHTHSYDPQRVSDIASSLITHFPIGNREWVYVVHFVKCSLIMSYPMTNPTSLWVTTFHLKCQSHQILFYHQQLVSDIADFVKNSLVTYSPMINSLWVMLHILWRLPHHSFSYDQQQVSDHIVHCLKGSLITAFPMNNSEWVTFHRQFHHFFSHNQQLVSNIAHFVKHSSITPFSMTNSKWVRLHIVWKAVSSHLLLWPTVCQRHCTFCETQSHHMFLLTNRKWVTLHPFLHAFSVHRNSWMFNMLFCPVYIRKWACCHIYPMSSFYIIVIIDCKIWFQLTPHVIIPVTYMTFIFQVSDANSWDIDFDISLHASV